MVMNICSPGEVTLLRRGELCRELSQAASNLNMILSSPGISRYSPETAFFLRKLKLQMLRSLTWKQAK